MKVVAVMFTAMLMASVEAGGQSFFVFMNKSGFVVDAPFVLCTDPPGTSSVSAGYQVQLFGGNPGATLEQLVPTVPPGTTFRPDRPGYVWGIAASVPGLRTNP